eukprot:gene14769-24481_t
MAYMQYKVGLGSGARQSVRRKKISMGALSAGLSELEEAPPPPPARKNWEFDRSKLSDLRQIGEGNFGVVYLAKAEGLVPGEGVTEVAIKTLQSEEEAADQEFMSEVKVMKAVSKCESIVQLLAVCTDVTPKYMIMEFMPKGDLKDNFEVVDEVSENDYRMPAPTFCPAGFHAMMLQCWESEPEDRGTFADKHATLLEMASRLSDAPITRAEWRGGVAPAAADDDGGEDEAPAASEDIIRSQYDEMDVAAYEEPAEVKARGGARTVRTLYARPVIADADAVDSASIVAWITATCGQPVDASDLHAGLMSGQVLCTLANALKAGSVRKIHDKPKAIKQKQNIARALVAFQALGVSADDLFEVEDLFDDLDMFRVMLCLAELKKVSS